MQFFPLNNLLPFLLKGLSISLCIGSVVQLTPVGTGYSNTQTHVPSTVTMATVSTGGGINQQQLFNRYVQSGVFKGSSTCYMYMQSMKNSVRLVDILTNSSPSSGLNIDAWKIGLNK